MKGFYTSNEHYKKARNATVYTCNHKLYNSCTLYSLKNGLGFAVIQERFNEKQKVHWWGPIDPWLADDIYNSPKFMDRFRRIADFPNEEGLYPTIEVRSLMHLIGMKPMKKQFWERPHDPQVLKGF